jgi:hypothetical protein
MRSLDVREGGEMLMCEVVFLWGGGLEGNLGGSGRICREMGRGGRSVYEWFIAIVRTIVGGLWFGSSLRRDEV